MALSGGFMYSPTNIYQLIVKVRIVRELERLDQMRLDSSRVPLALHGRSRHSTVFGHCAVRPMRCIGRRGVLGVGDHLVDLFLRDRNLSSTLAAFCQCN